MTSTFCCGEMIPTVFLRVLWIEMGAGWWDGLKVHRSQVAKSAIVCLFGWLFVCLVAWLFGWLVTVFVCLFVCLVGWLVGWLVGCWLLVG